ncbi:MAG: (E)-4-hydroxy-3-methylbut-2-enyl-diphosphate synthase [Deltaproteobacteria bacterium]|nr:(E)-4-hydroxy-3-methylbut-2-enyl-diphosphate synthase [Deltaproteobacteria bacterium]
MSRQRFTATPFWPVRRPTREVRIGDVGIGGRNPIRVQSMTTTDTQDTKTSADQIERLVAAGCEIVRLTAPSIRDAENLREISAELGRRRVRVPLVADIHFTPNAAMIAAEHVEKVRINPGNFADRKKFEVREYDDAAWSDEIARVAARFRPLVRRCKELGRAIRIGTNHGSLSDRILNRYGDTPSGMVASALEFLDVCEAEGFFDVVFSMKASNTQVAIAAYRLLADRLAERAPGRAGYPFHVGVTEAGDGEDGRIKSAIGIGALLEDGIGDTIRVSLTEDPVREIPVARALAARYDARAAALATLPVEPCDPGAPFVDDPFAHARRATCTVGLGAVAFGGQEPVRAEIELGPVPADPAAAARALAASLAAQATLACEGLIVDCDAASAPRLDAFAAALASAGVRAPLAARLASEDVETAAKSIVRVVVPVTIASSRDGLAMAADGAARRGVALEWQLEGRPPVIPALVDRALTASHAAAGLSVLFSVASTLPVHATRALVARLRARAAAQTPVVLRHRRDPSDGDEAAILHAATDLGALLCDGIGDAVAVGGFGDAGRALDLAYRILQGARLRTSWTEFISCPSCGRTLFDLEETTARIKARTQHLSGLKIAIMGCIVNGPGEMADADFGYVGAGPGIVNLYVGREIVERQVPQDEAPDRLVELIRRCGRWADPA